MYTLDTENRLTSVTVSGQVTTFAYDPDGNLVKKIKPDGSKTLYVGGIYEVGKNSGGTVTGTKTYYPAAGAMRVGSTLYYVLKDHLGSASVLTDNTGTIVSGADTRYYPFGEARFSTSSMLTDKLYTGQREITGLGIYHYQARFYSPTLGRFLSADTIVSSFANPQSLNRFSYVLNNPLKYTDPTGHKEDDGCHTTGCGGTINYKKYPCAGMQGLVRDICSRGPKKPKTTKEIVKDLVTFFDPSEFLEDALSYPAGGPGYFVPAICRTRGKVCSGDTVDFVSDVSKLVYKIMATGAPERPPMTPTPFLSPTPDPTSTLVTPTITMTPTITPTPTFTPTPFPTMLPPPTSTSTPILTPVYWVP